MTWLCDKDEKDEYIKSMADGLGNLQAGEEFVGPDGTPYHFDHLVVMDLEEARASKQSGFVEPAQEVKIEKKTWSDLIQSWHEGRLERQLSYVDAFLVEIEPLELFDIENDNLKPRPGESTGSFQHRMQRAIQDRERVLNHVTAISFAMPVIISFGPASTVERLRYIERQRHLAVRANKIKWRAKGMRERILETMSGVNMMRLLGDGQTVGDKVMAQAPIDWALIARALNPISWHRVDLGPGERRIPLATCKKIHDLIEKGGEDHVKAK